MATEQLSVQLTADISNFKANLAAAVSEVNKASASINKSTSIISSNVSSFNKIGLSGFKNALKGGEISIRNISSASKSIPSEITSITPKVKAATNDWAKNLLAIPKTIEQDVNPGIDSIADVSKKTFDNLDDAVVSSTVSMDESVSVITDIIDILPGITVAGALAFAAGPVIKYVASLLAVKDELSELEIIRRQLNDVSLIGSKNSQSEITELNTLYAITQDTTISTKQRREAVDELQKLYPAYFRNITDEYILTGKAKEAYDKLTTSIIATARARAAQDVITKNSQRQLENEAKIQETLIEYDKQKLIAANALKQLGAAGQSQSARFNANAAARAEEERAKYAEIIRNLKKDTEIIDGRNLKLTEEITKQVKIGADLAGGVGDLDKEKTGNKIKTLAEILKDLAIDIKQVDSEFKLTFGEKADKRIDAYTSALKEMVKIGIDPVSEAYKKVEQARQDAFQLPFIKDGDALLGITAPKNTAKVTGKEDTSILANLSKIQQEMLLAQATIYQAQDDFNKDFNQLVQTGLVDSLSGIGEAIGTALIEGGDVFASIGNSLLAGFGQFLSQFGKLLVEYGAAAILKSKLDAAILIPGAGLFAGAAAIAAGIALQVAAAAFSSLAGKGSKSSSGGRSERVTAFADGGIISGPTLGLMGEYSGAKTNPEVVAPLNKLKSMLGDTSPKFEVIQYIEGDKLAVLVRNANNRLGRI